MGRLDDELAQAASEAEESAPDSAVPREDERQSAPAGQAVVRIRRRWGLLLALLLMGAAVLVLVLTSVEQAAIYSKGVDELVAERDRLRDRNVRVDGTLVSGSLLRRDEPCEYRFAIAKNDVRVDVRYPRCVVPDTFRDLPGTRVEVTVEGQLTEAGYVAADRILAKCPSRYEMDERRSGGAQQPHASPAASGSADSI